MSRKISKILLFFSADWNSKERVTIVCFVGHNGLDVHDLFVLLCCVHNPSIPGKCHYHMFNQKTHNVSDTLLLYLRLHISLSMSLHVIIML